MSRRRLTPEERALLASIAEGERRGRLATIATIIEAASAALIGAHYTEVAANVLSSGIVQATETLSALSEGSWRAAWRVVLRGPIQVVMDEAEMQTNRGVYRPTFDVSHPEAEEFIGQYLDRLAELLTRTTRDNIGEVLEEAKRDGYSIERTAQRIREEAPKASRQRAEFISRDQMLKASKAGANFKARSSGVIVAKSRHDSNDGRVRDSHRRWDGERVGITEVYSSGEIFPGQLEFQCRCSERFHIDPVLLGERSA